MADLKHVKGLADLQRLLDQLPAKLEANVMRGGLRAGANVVKKEAAQNINSQSGELAKSLRVSTRVDRRKGRVTASVKTKRNMAHIARFVEFGTRPHLISVDESEKPINKRLSKKRGEVVRASMRTVNNALRIGQNFYSGVMHPGAKPHPFMRPALDSKATDATVAVGNYIKRRLQTKHGLDTADIAIEAGEE